MARDNSLLKKWRRALGGRTKEAGKPPPDDEEVAQAASKTSEDPESDDTVSAPAVMTEHSFKVFLTAAVKFQYESPRLAGTLLYLTAHGAALLGDLAVSLEYLGYVVNAYLQLPKKAKETFEEILTEQSTSSTGLTDVRFNLHAGILCATIHTWKVPIVGQVLLFRDILKQLDSLKTFPEDRKNDLFMIGGALFEDIKQLGGDEGSVREALDELRRTCAGPQAPLDKAMIDFIACAFLEIGKVEKESAAVAFLEFCLQFIPFLSGDRPASEPIYLPKLSEIVHSLTAANDVHSGGDDDSPSYVM